MPICRSVPALGAFPGQRVSDFRSDPTVSLHSARVVFPDGAIALDNVSLAFDERAFTVLLGPSGAGKSTLLRCLNLLVAPTRGSVHCRGLGLLCGDAAVHARLLRQHRGRTAMIFQSHQLIGRHSALKNVLLGRLAHHGTFRTFLPLPRRDRVIALSCLERVGLSDLSLQRTDRLSGGQRQRVGIARALAQEPRLILADEPVASLDPATAESVLALLHRVCREDGLTAIVSLHQLGFARRFADRVVGLARGSVVFDGPPDALGSAELRAIYGRDVEDEPRRVPAAHDFPFPRLEVVG
jgi:phosphonate transport system ATP-binding protein